MLATATAYRGASSLKDKELCRVFPVLGDPAPLPDTLKPKPDTLNRISCWGVPVFRAACRPCSPRSPLLPFILFLCLFFVHVGLVSVCSARIFKDVVSPGMCRVPVAALGLWIRFSSFLSLSCRVGAGGFHGDCRSSSTLRICLSIVSPYLCLNVGFPPVSAFFRTSSLPVSFRFRLQVQVREFGASSVTYYCTSCTS